MRVLFATEPRDVPVVLRGALEDAGMTQLQMAHHMGFSAKHMSHMMTGRAGISIPHLFAMLDYLGVRIVMAPLSD